MKRRVRPFEPRRGAVRSDVLLNVVERVLERPALGVPGGQQLLVGAPAEQKRAVFRMTLPASCSADLPGVLPELTDWRHSAERRTKRRPRPGFSSKSIDSTQT